MGNEALEIAGMHHTGDVGLIDRSHQVRQFQLVLGLIGHIADDGELKSADG